MGKKRTELDQAVQPFVALYNINQIFDIDDDKPLIDIMPGAWPTWGELKRLYEALPKRHKEWRR